jgi:aminoglycoside phosphotransferase (APT) family kinase protein
MTASTRLSRSGFTHPADVMEILASRAAEYYPDWTGARVEIETVKVIDRSSSRLLHFRLQAARVSRDVIVKLRSLDLPIAPPSEAPSWLRLCPFPPEQDLGRAEAAALSSIYQHFADSDPRFRPVRLLEYREDWHGLIMEFARGEELDRRLLAAHRFGAAGSSAARATPCQQAGAWLRRYHEMPGALDGPQLRADRASIVQCFSEVLSYLGDTAGPCSLFSRLEERLEAQANAVLPETLLTQRVHGDFWPGNVLVGPDGRITVIDTFGYGATPRYEDIAYFLVHLRAMKPQMYTLGAWIRKEDSNAWEAAFLAGYFGEDPIPIGAVRLFELLTLLYKWASAENATRRSVGAHGYVKRAQLEWKRRFFRGLARSRFDAVEGAVADPQGGAR